MTIETTQAGAVFKARTPEDLLAVVPAVLGFHPEESLVMLTFGGRRSFHARVDLPEEPGHVAQVVDMLLTPALRQRPETVLFVAYSTDPARAASTALHASDAFDAHGFAVIKPLRSDGTSWFHVRRDEDPERAEPHPYDLSSHALTAQSVLDGRVTLASRAAVAASVASDPVAAEAVLNAWLAQLEEALPGPAEVRTLVARGLARDPGLSDREVARLAHACLDPAVRDAAWSDLRCETVEDQLDFWREVVVRTPDVLVAGVAAVLGFAAWLAGHGALSWCAVDRASAADPDCSLARLVADLLQAAVPPTAWSDIAPTTEA
jgi:hypothetical protein